MANFHNIKKTFRFSKYHVKYINELMKKFPEKYDTISSVVRGAINNLYIIEMKNKKRGKN